MKTKSLPLSVLMALMLSMPMFAIVLPVNGSPTPQITLSPHWGWYDTVVWVYGTGFAADSHVIITWGGLDYWQVFASTNVFGDFSVSFNVPDDSIAGDHIITAIDEYDNTASDTFTLHHVYVDGGLVGIDSPKQRVQWRYDEDEFYCDSWEFFHGSYDGWYDIMYNDYGIYVFRITYDEVTYVFDLASGLYNAWPQPLVEEVVGFELTDINHVEGTIRLYDPTGGVLLVTVIVDVVTPLTPEDHYAMSFRIVAETELDDLSFYVAYNLDVYIANPNWAYYENSLDVVYQYYGPSYYCNDIPERRKCYAGFASLMPASTHHDVMVNYQYVQLVANLRDYDFNYRDNYVALGDHNSDCGVGLQWAIGPMSIGDEATIPVAFAVSDETFDTFKASVMQGKLFAYGLMSQPPVLTLSPVEDVGFSMVSISGEGFMPYAQVDVYFGNVLVAPFIADSEGSIESKFVVPVVKADDYIVTAIDEYGLQAETVFTVNMHLDDLAEAIASLELQLDELSELVADTAEELSLTHEDLSELISYVYDDLELKIDDLADLVNTLTSEGEYSLSDIASLVGDLEEKLDLTMEDLADLIEDVADNHEELIEVIEDLAPEMSLSDLAELIGALEVKLDDIVIPFLEHINATVASVETKVDGYYLLLNASVSDIEVKLDETVIPLLQAINTTVVDIRDDLILMNTTIGEIEVELDETVIPLLEGINATIVDIKDNLVTFNSTLGEIQLDLDAVSLELESVQGDIEEGSANITAAITDVKGNILAELDSVTVSLADINMEIEAVNGTIVNMKTDIGTIQGTITSIQEDIVTIQTDIGTITTTTDSIKSDISLQPVTIALSSIATISAIIAAVIILRKVYVK